LRNEECEVFASFILHRSVTQTENRGTASPVLRGRGGAKRNAFPVEEGQGLGSVSGDRLGSSLLLGLRTGKKSQLARRV